MSMLNITCCLWPTMVSFITDADYSTCTVAMAAAKPGTGLSNVNMVHSPALTLSCPLFLNPAELGCPVNKPEKAHSAATQKYVFIPLCITLEFVRSYPEETWSGSWTVTLVHVELLTGL